jgi:hypothetical protein
VWNFSQAKAGARQRTRGKVERSRLFDNSFLLIDYGRDRAVALFRAWFTGMAQDLPTAHRSKAVT